MNRLLRVVGAWIVLGISTAQAAGVVALDGYHNNETRHPGHYRWENTDPGGYSQLAALIESLGGKTRTIREPLSAGNLKDVDVLIIADPNTPAVTPDPKYIEDSEIEALDGWVRNGGHLLLFGNNEGNSEFEHLNRLARRFGVDFVEGTYRDARGQTHFSPLSTSPQLGVGSPAYLVNVAPLHVSNPEAQMLLRDGDNPIMVQIPYEKGTVIALGDPWLYNEYINAFGYFNNNMHLASNLFATLLSQDSPADAAHTGRLDGAPLSVRTDLSQVHPGPVNVSAAGKTVTVRWDDEAKQQWTAKFSLAPGTPLLTELSKNGGLVVKGASPQYELTMGKRTGGWDQFADEPALNPQGLRTFKSQFVLKSVSAFTVGDRIELSFDGLYLGPFRGSLHYVFFPGSRLIEQAALVSTNEPNTAYVYDAGLNVKIDAEAIFLGRKNPPEVSYYDTEGQLRKVALETVPSGPEPLRVRYRTLAAQTGAGSLAVFPAPHRYLYPRDFTVNQGYVSLASGWSLSLGIRQDHDGVLINAPPGTVQRLSLFLLPTSGEPQSALEDVVQYTHRDRFPSLDGYTTFTSHYHFAYTVRAMEKGFNWTPAFKPVLKSLGVHSVMLMDFHGDGHADDPGEVRLRELRAYYEGCQRLSDADFLMIPAEEADVYLGGHWGMSFPKPVYWHMTRSPSESFEERDATYGTVYNVSNAKEMLELIRKENAFVYQAHPRTKSSTGYPDLIKDQDYFKDAHYVGAGWKALPSDLSTPRLGERALKLLDDMSNWGVRKEILGEVDIFDIDHTHELYAHMNINYVHLPAPPPFDHYDKMLDVLRAGDFFISTGEVLIPEVKITEGAHGKISVRARIQNTFPLQMAEVVWGDGSQTYRKTIPLTGTHSFGDFKFSTEVNGGNWKWARFAVWDVAADGAFINPVWRK